MSLFRYYYQVNPQAGSSPAFDDAVLALLPTGYWRLGEASGNPADSSGNGYTFNADGTPTYGVAGWAEGDDAMTFASGDELRLSTASWMDMGTSDWSVCWAMKMSSWPASNAMILGHDGQGYDGQWYVALNGTADTVTMFFGDSSGSWSAADITTAADLLDDDAWHFCVLTCDRSDDATLYVDGTTLDTGYEYTDDISAGVAYDTTTPGNRDLWVANRSDDGTWPFAGSLDELAFWNDTLLTRQQVQDLYDARSNT